MSAQLVFRGKNNQGFTLIELMIVVVIVGILAAIAYPSYTRYVQRANETETKGQMMELASQLEAYRAKNFSYSGATLSRLAPQLSSNANYSMRLDLKANTYSIVAVPNAFMKGWPELTYDSITGPNWE